MRPYVVLSCLAALACLSLTPNASAQNGLPPGKWTVIVHGRESGQISCGYPGTYDDLTAEWLPHPDDWKNWMRRLAGTIERESPTPVNVYRISANTLELITVNDGGTSPSDDLRHHVLMFDWARTSGIYVPGPFPGLPLFCTVHTGNEQGFAYAAADALYATLRYFGADQKVFATIGYSRGAVVCSELTKRLIVAGHDPRQVVYLDGEGCDDTPTCGEVDGTCSYYADGVFDAWWTASPTQIQYYNIYELYDENYGLLDIPGTCGLDLGGHCKDRVTDYDVGPQYAHTPFLGSVWHCRNSYEERGIWEHLIDDMTVESGSYVIPGTPGQPVLGPRVIQPSDLQPYLFNGDFELGSIAGWFGNGGGSSPNETGGAIGTFGGTFALSIIQGSSQAHSYFAMPNRECLIYFDAARAGIFGFGDDELIVAIYSPDIGEVELEPRLRLADDLTDTLQNKGPYIVPPAFRGKACSLRFTHTAAGGSASSVWLDNVTLTPIGPPPNPANPIIVESSCGNATLGFAGSPPPGVSWFWQHQICATRVDLGSEPIFTAHTIGTYYLKARCDQTGEWSDGCASVQVTQMGDVPTGDVDSSGTVDLTDLSILLAHFGSPSGMLREDGDLDSDGDVDLSDLSLLLGHFGLSCSQVWGNALQFDHDAVWVPYQAFNGLGDFTIEMWVYVTEAGADAFSTNFYLSLARAGQDNWVILFSTPSGEFRGDFLGTQSLFLGSPLPLNAWTHLALSRAGSTMTAYLNGMQANTVVVLSSPLLVDANGAFLGNDQDCVGGCFDAPSQAFTGLMDDVRLWSVARTGPEILSSMSAPLTGSEIGLRAYWRFDELSGQTILDSSMHGYGGHLGTTNAPAGDAFDPVRVPSSVP